ncbi:class I SAM-dependent methyltransferase [Arachidicoccus soli]|uniref:Class I SAM-dependent methyltransferase n=1 Tax=Arachidicoccus soli TaxID=2341117 RepID=A0A386HQW2_9BACT|nr:class I SAM-dependent methyltransferase [Arachidicoccus soli]AYD48049.1 class I SAM-dependent methyltransferase [Arachidicoccus soli]
MNYSQVPKEFNPSLVAPNYLTRQGLLKAISKNVPSLKGRMMDFGCGAKPYQSLFSVEEYIGVDYAGEGHSHENENVDVFYNGKVIPFENEYFDAVFSTEVFEHIFNLNEILKEIYRVLKPGGRLLITCPFSICEHEIPNDFARYTSFAIKHILEENGFEVLLQDKIGCSITTVFQLWEMYIHQNIAPRLQKIPVIRSVFRIITYSILNSCALVLKSILPKGKELYLNNIVLAQKPLSQK